MYGNMKEFGGVDGRVVEGSVVVVAEVAPKLIGVSEIIEIRVSAARMPPMEWPMSMTLTDGSMVGAGVPSFTSRSITMFWSLSRLRTGCGGFFPSWTGLPIAKTLYALPEISSCLVFGIDYSLDGDIRKGGADHGLQVAWKACKSIVISLDLSVGFLMRL